jgi:hypothetical protein
MRVECLSPFRAVSEPVPVTACIRRGCERDIQQSTHQRASKDSSNTKAHHDTGGIALPEEPYERGQWLPIRLTRRLRDILPGGHTSDPA